MDATLLESYSRALAEEFADADVLAVLQRVVKSRRGEFEAKVPALGDLLQMVRDYVNERKRVAREAKENAEWEEHKARCERERLEELAAGPRELTETEIRLQRILDATPGTGRSRQREQSQTPAA